jgi:hypothetical protein
MPTYQLLFCSWDHRNMSADACLAFYGLRFEVRSEEIEGLEMRSDPRVLATRKVRLKHYWANFGAQGERYLLFVGAQLGVLGPECTFNGCRISDQAPVASAFRTRNEKRETRNGF